MSPAIPEMERYRPMDSGDIAAYAESLGRVVTHLGSALSMVGA